MKAVKKVLALVLAAAAVFGCMGNSLAASPKVEVLEDLASENAIVSRCALDVMPQAVEALVNNGAAIDSDTLIEVLPINETNDKAVCVVNLDDSVISRDIFITTVEDEFGNMVVDNTLADDIISYGSEDRVVDWDDGIGVTLHAVAYENIFVADYTCYQPYKLRCEYVNVDNKSVGSFTASFQSVGFLYNTKTGAFVPNPDYASDPTLAQSEPYWFNIVCSSSQSGSWKEKTDQKLVNMNWMMNMTSGHMFLGHFVIFDIVVDGKSYHYQLELPYGI